jgi:PAS domain S-box-containing protein
MARVIDAALWLYKKTSASILVVDDVPENLELLADVLSDDGYLVVSSTSGADALEQLKKNKIHLIVADAMMPKMDGLEFCKRVRSNPLYSKTPFIIYTGNYIDKEDQELARVIGVNQYVMKSDGVNALIQTINDLLVDTYGLDKESVKNTPVHIDDQIFLEKHHSIVTKKLEDKMKELQLYTDTLSMKNRELTISHNRYRALFENAIEAIIVVDTKSLRIVDVNKQGEKLLQYKRDEVLQLETLPLTTEDGSTPDIYDIENPFVGEAKLRAKDGDLLTVDITSGPIHLPEEPTRAILFIRDITEQIKMREQMFQSERMSTMGRIAAGIAHEIRNPLAGISLNLQFLDRHIASEGIDHDSVAAALEGVARIQQVIDDTLGLARVTPPTFRKESVNPLIEKTLSYNKLGLRNKDISVRTSFAQDLPQVRIDANQIQQVFLNALQNAIDASPESGIIEITTKVSSAEGHEPVQFVEVDIHDSGAGLSKNVEDHLFEPFRTTKAEGTGLGLMLSKYIIDRHQGKITIKNSPQGGALVSVFLPV